MLVERRLLAGDGQPELGGRSLPPISTTPGGRDLGRRPGLTPPTMTITSIIYHFIRRWKSFNLMRLE